MSNKVEPVAYRWRCPNGEGGFGPWTLETTRPSGESIFGACEVEPLYALSQPPIPDDVVPTMSRVISGAIGHPQCEGLTKAITGALTASGLLDQVKALREALDRHGEALHGLSAQLLLSKALDEDAVHAAYEKVVSTFAALNSQQGEG